MGKTPLLFDIETDGQSPFIGQLLLVGWCLVGGPVQVYDPEAHEGEPGYHDEWELKALQDYLADPERPKVTMTKYDSRYLRLQGWEVAGPLYDIQVMAWVLNENQPLNLDMLSLRYMREKMDKRLRRSAGEVLFRCDDGREVNLKVIRDDEAFAQFRDYCWRDVDSEARLFQTLWERLEDTTWLDFYIEECVPFTSVLLGMECAGLPVNLIDSEELREELEEKVAELGPHLLDTGGLPSSFNLNSNDQLAAYLYHPVAELVDSIEYDEWTIGALKSCLAGEHDDCEDVERGPLRGGDDMPALWQTRHCIDLLPVGFTLDKLGRTQAHGRWTFKGRNMPWTEKTDSGKLSVASPVLKSNVAAYSDPWVLELFGFRQMTKALTTYLRKYPTIANEGRLYGRFNQTGTKTGRLSSSEPNLQNQPSHGPLGERMRALFQGRLVVGDYSQLEPRLMAHFSEDPRLLDVYRNDKDIYVYTAEGIFGHEVGHDDVERGIAKTLVLAMGYGAGKKKVAQILTINGFPTEVDQAEDYLLELQQLYSQFFAWREAVIRRVKVKGYVETMSGRHRRLKSAFADRRNWKNVGYGERQAVNAVVQGSAGDIVARVMARGNWQHEQRLLAQVHDELVWDWDGVTDPSPQQLEYIQHVGETAHGFTLNVPLKFEPHFGPSWFAAKEGVELPADLNEETSGYEEEDS